MMIGVVSPENGIYANPSKANPVAKTNTLPVSNCSYSRTTWKCQQAE